MNIHKHISIIIPFLLCFRLQQVVGTCKSKKKKIFKYRFVLYFRIENHISLSECVDSTLATLSLICLCKTFHKNYTNILINCFFFFVGLQFNKIGTIVVCPKLTFTLLFSSNTYLEYIHIMFNKTQLYTFVERGYCNFYTGYRIKIKRPTKMNFTIKMVLIEMTLCIHENLLIQFC